MTLPALEVTPGVYALVDRWSVAAPDVIAEDDSGDVAEARALGEKGDEVTLVDDTFTGTDSTALDTRVASPTAGPNPWVADAGFTIQSNWIEGAHATEDLIAAIDVEAADVVLTCEVYLGFGERSEGWQGIVVRGTDAVGSGEYLVFRPHGWDNTRRFVLADETGAHVAEFHLGEAQAVHDFNYLFEAKCSGDHLTFSVDGIEVGQHTLDAGTYVGTEFGIWTGERSATPIGSFDVFEIQLLDDVDASGLSALATGIVRYFSFRPPVPPAGSRLELMQVILRQSRTGYGVWRPRLGVLDDDGDIVWGPAFPSPTEIAHDGIFVDRYSQEVTTLLDGRPWSRFDPLDIIVRLETLTEDASQAFGDAIITRLLARFRWNARPTVTIDDVDVSGSNPVVSWTFADTDGDAQQSFEVRVWDPADIAANPTLALEDVPAVYTSGRIISAADRLHRLADSLGGGTLYTFGVRAYQAKVAKTDFPSEWDTFDATTPDALDSTPTVVAVAGVGQATLTITDLGAANAANIYRSVSGAAEELVATEVDITSERTQDAVDSFDRADGALGDEEGTNTYTWTIDSGPSTTSTTTIVSNGAVIDGDGAAVIATTDTDVAARAVVDLALAPAGVRVRGGATGVVEAVVDSDTVRLATFDAVGDEHPANTIDVQHGVSADTATIELIAAGDEYVVLLNGEILIRNIDATVPSRLETETGIATAQTTGTHRVESFEVRLLDHEIVWVDQVPPQGKTLDYDVIGVLKES
jgi:hypothetical protein